MAYLQCSNRHEGQQPIEARQTGHTQPGGQQAGQPAVGRLLVGAQTVPGGQRADVHRRPGGGGVMG